MKEKWYIIKKGIPYCLALLLSAFAFPLQAQIEQEDSIRITYREPADSSTIQQAELQHDTVWIVKHVVSKQIRPSHPTLPQPLGSPDTRIQQNPVRRQYRTRVRGSRLGLWTSQSVGDRHAFRHSA